MQRFRRATSLRAFIPEVIGIKEVVYNLDGNAELALRSVIGKLNIGFYFPDPWISVNREGFDVSSVSIPTGKGAFLVATCEWGDTDKDFLDVYYFDVSIEEQPRDIAAVRVADSPSGWGFEHVSTINTGDWTIIERVSVYEFAIVGTLESVRYDRAILFDYGKGQILLSAGNTAPGRFEVQYKAEVIANILDTLRLRKVITDEHALTRALTEKAKIESGQFE